MISFDFALIDIIIIIDIFYVNCLISVLCYTFSFALIVIFEIDIWTDKFARK
jgi:hypothetical protein